MTRMLELGWWALAVRGVAAVIIGLMLLFVPGITLAAGGLSLVLLFSIFAIVSGGSMVASALRKREGQWLLWTILGVVSIIAGVYMLFHPLTSAVITIALVVNIIGIWAIVNGVMEIAVAWRIRHEIDHEVFMILSGILSVIFGIIVLLRPDAALPALVTVMAFYLLFNGGLNLALAWRARGFVNSLRSGTPSPRGP